MKLTISFGPEVDKPNEEGNIITSDTVLDMLESGKAVLTVAYQASPDGRRVITEVSVIPAERGVYYLQTRNIESGSKS